MLIGIIGWIVMGLLVGFAASKIANLRGDDPRLGIALSAAGAVIGGWLYSAISGAEVNGFNPLSLLFAIIGAILAAIIWHLFRRRFAPPMVKPW
jgi:uncharacterized membrane protein YeaQ/YmgE (transglycosylase-associated protein family)